MTVDPSRCAALILAGGRGAGLHELCDAEAPAALPVGAGRRLVDFALHAVAEAGIVRVVVALGHRPETLRRHLPERWGAALSLRDVPAEAARACLPDMADAAAVVVLSAERLGFIDVPAFLAAHRAGGAAVTAAAEGGAWAVDPARAAPDLDAPDLHAPDLGAPGAVWRAGGTWRAIDTLDALREGALDLARGGLPPPLPPALGPGLPERRELVMEAGGLRLAAPRFGARRPGRWTVLDESAVLPGGRVGPGARLSRVVVAPGAVVPATLVVGDDPEEDARHFRVTPGGTTLVTAPMLAARAAHLMRARGHARARANS